jgi:NadR type nicotinamide-nucleotide adenylyltransferase
VVPRPLSRIVVTGPECSGKTTLAHALGEALNSPVVPEAARLFAEWHGELSAATVEPIATLSMRLEDEAVASLADASATIVRDTDLVSTVVYARHYYGMVAPWVEDEAAARRGDLYLLCEPDLPWIADGIRDRPAHREEMRTAFAEALARIGARVATVSGSGAVRTSVALDAVRDAGFSARRAASA